MRLCSGPGCGRAVPNDVRFCDECKAEHTKTVDTAREHTCTDRERYAFLYSGYRWRVKVQPIALRRCPMCARCNMRVSEIVDHVVPAGVVIQQARDSGLFRFDKWAGFYLLCNLQGLCRACHYDKTDEDKLHSGPWPDVIAQYQAQSKKHWAF